MSNYNPVSEITGNAVDAMSLDGRDVRPYRALPLSPRCEEIVRRAQHALVGISPFNNYYSHARICSLLQWAQGAFHSFSVLLPGEEAALTLIAAGEPAHTAASKARLQVCKLRSRALDAMSRIGISNGQSRVFSLAQFAENSVYKQLRRDVRDCYLRDARFRELCLDAARTVVAKRLPEGTAPTAVQMEIAVEYLMAEIPLLLDTPSILNVETSVFCYHQMAPLFKGIFRRELAIVPSPAQAGAEVVAEPWDRGDDR